MHDILWEVLSDKKEKGRLVFKIGNADGKKLRPE
tara:strand:+ start:2226 stop:2327 length:102 start_codon:yes stop_codon:yes gene_type:complete